MHDVFHSKWHACAIESQAHDLYIFVALRGHCHLCCCCVGRGVVGILCEFKNSLLAVRFHFFSVCVNKLAMCFAGSLSSCSFFFFAAILVLLLCCRPCCRTCVVGVEYLLFDAEPVLSGSRTCVVEIEILALLSNTSGSSLLIVAYWHLGGVFFQLFFDDGIHSSGITVDGCDVVSICFHVFL